MGRKNQRKFLYDVNPIVRALIAGLDLVDRAKWFLLEQMGKKKKLFIALMGARSDA